MSPEEVLDTVPGWEHAAWRKLPGGISNKSFLLEQDGRRAVLKIDASPRLRPFNTRAEEFKAQSRAASVRLATRPLHASETIYLSEYSDGRAWAPADLQDHGNLRSLAELLRSLHALPSSGRQFDAVAAAETYLADIDNERRQAADEHLSAIAHTPVSVNTCFCHNDLVAENILEADGLRLLDFEYACDNDPVFDLATIVTHHDLDQAAVEALLSAYFSDSYDTDRGSIHDRLAAMCKLYSSLCWLWAAARS